MRHTVMSLFSLALILSASFTTAQRELWWDDFESYREGQTNISKTGGGPGPYDRQQNCQCFHYPTDPRCKCSAQTGKNSHIIVRDPAFCGKQALRFERNNGDAYPKHSGSSARNELVTPPMWNTGDDVWIGYALYMCSKGYGANGKWRNPPKSNRTILFNQVTNGKPTFGLRINWDRDGGNYYFHMGVKDLGKNPIPWDEWVAVVVHLIWKSGGLVEVYQNGKKVYQGGKSFAPNGYKKFKIGQYANTAAVGYPQIAFIDNLKIAVGKNLLNFVSPVCTGGSTFTIPRPRDGSMISRKGAGILRRLVDAHSDEERIFTPCGRRVASVPAGTLGAARENIGVFIHVPMQPR